MENNEFNRRVRYALKLDDAATQRLMLIGGKRVDADRVAGYRLKSGERGHVACPDEDILALLDGLIRDRRGPPPPPSAASTDAARKRALSNNLLLKQLRIALSLRSDAFEELIALGGGKVGKGESSAFFRHPQARNYRVCGDQMLRCFLNGLAKKRCD